MFLGIDCGTQSTKLVLIDLEKNKIVAEASAPHTLTSNSRGGREQHPQIWIDAFHQAFHTLTKSNFGEKLKQTKAIGVSGQQHGLVILDENDEVIRPAKLWCDTETSLENQEIIDELGGSLGSVKQLGLEVLTGYTLSKILWLKKHEYESYQRIKKIMLPHDYLNFYLTGEWVAEAGDSSGTGYFDIVNRRWDEGVLKIIDPKRDLKGCLAQLLEPDEVVGKIKQKLADDLGLSKDVLVATGGGDNMMGVVGSGNISPGKVTLSVGTSGTLSTVSQQPLLPNDLDQDDSALGIANFCSSHGGWLPLSCHMNITSTTNQFQQLLGLTTEEFFSLASEAEVGAGGVVLLPFLNGERVPNLPDSKGVLDGLDMVNLTRENIARSSIEGASFTLKHGYDLFSNLLDKQNLEINELIMIGGGAKSPFWCQMMADLTNKPIMTLKNQDVAAVGAALQAAWCYELSEGRGVGGRENTSSELDKQSKLEDLAKQIVETDKIFTPVKSQVDQYQLTYQNYKTVLNRLFQV